ncbi:MAG: hypothetical protein ACR2MD_08155 [Aridibacter sp.]
MPFSLTMTGGSIISSFQYPAKAEALPGKVKPGSVDIAILCVLPIPDSQIFISIILF